MRGWLAPGGWVVAGLHLPDAAELLRAVGEWGTPALSALLLLSAAGVPLPVEYAVVAIGALSAQEGGPNALGLLMVGTAAAVAGDALDYALGRLGMARLWGWLARRRRRVGEDVKPPRVPAGLLQRRGMAVLLTRFVFAPASTPMSIFAGASGYAFLAFLLWDAGGEAIYVGGNLALGRLFGTRLLEPQWQTVLFWMLVGVVSLLPMLVVRRVASPSGPPSRPPRDLDMAM